MPTAIPYVDEVWNCTDGCSPVGPGCDHCWASRWAHRMEGMGHTRFAGLTTPEGTWTGEVRERSELLDMPLHWKKPRRIFVCSMSDLFHPAVSDDFITDVCATMHACEQLTFLILTKRPARMREYADTWSEPNGATNILWGFSAWDQASLDAGWEHVRHIAGRTWVSLEPLLAPVDLRAILCSDTPPAWIVAGGESGPGYRHDDQMWYRAILGACQRAGVPVWLKQRAGARPGLPLVIDGRECKEIAHHV